MKNTEYNSNLLGSIITSADSLKTLMGMIDDMELEITDVIAI